MVTRETLRLRAPRDVSRVLSSGDRRSGRLLAVHRARTEEPGVRLAFVASKRVGGAVRRNRAKRLLREAARGVDWRPGQDVVLVARAACADARLEEVSDELHRLLGALHATS